MTHTHDREAANTLPANAFVPDRDWCERLFSTVDAGDATGFLRFLTPDAQFRFGNAPAVTGAAAIGAAVAGFFAAIGSSRHHLIAIWHQAASALCEGEVTYLRHDGSAVSFPFANVFEFRGEKIAAYRIYIDNSSLFAPAAAAGHGDLGAVSRPN
jgi:ketosteroid isomerase-like protein